MSSRTLSIIDLNGELAKLTMFRRTPHSTREQTKGSSEGNTHLGLTPFPSEHVERDVADPRQDRKGPWHRIRSVEGVTLMTATPFPSETIEDDLDDPRTVESRAI